MESMFYLNRAWLKSKGLESSKAEAALAGWLTKQPGFQAAYTRTQLQGDIVTDDEIGQRGLFDSRHLGCEDLARPDFADAAADQTLHLRLFGACHHDDAIEVALVGRRGSSKFRALETAVATHYVPSLVLAGGPPGESQMVKLLDDRPLIDDQPTAYVCRGYACDRPVTDADTLSEQLENAAKAGAVATA